VISLDHDNSRNVAFVAVGSDVKLSTACGGFSTKLIASRISVFSIAPVGVSPSVQSRGFGTVATAHHPSRVVEPSCPYAVLASAQASNC
jgi:hypothetical protein